MGNGIFYHRKLKNKNNIVDEYENGGVESSKQRLVKKQKNPYVCYDWMCIYSHTKPLPNNNKTL